MNSVSDDRTSNNTVRHQYRELSATEKNNVLMVKDAGEILIDAIRASGAGREASIAITHIETGVMWAVRGITA